MGRLESVVFSDTGLQINIGHVWRHRSAPRRSSKQFQHKQDACLYFVYVAHTMTSPHNSQDSTYQASYVIKSGISRRI